MLTALGFEFYDIMDNAIVASAKGLETISYIDTKNALSELEECKFRIASDVNNPLCGKNGCSHIFVKQKGANFQQIELMDKWLCNYSNVCNSYFGTDFSDYPGAGAAGGLGYAFLTFLNAKLESGVKIILDEIKLEEEIKVADIVITGEGKIDKQTIMGKAPIGIASLAKKYDKPVIAFCGMMGEGAEICKEYGIDMICPILKEITSLEKAMEKTNAYTNLRNTSFDVFSNFIERG